MDNPFIIKLVGGILLMAIIGGGLGALHHHIFQQGVIQEKERRDKMDAKNNLVAQQVLASANERAKKAQDSLIALQAVLSDKQQELTNANIKSIEDTAAYAAGTKRMSVLISSSKGSKAGSIESSSPASVGSLSPVTEDLAPKVAEGLERIRINENNAIDRLGACIIAYDAIKRATDSLDSFGDK